MSKKRTSYPLEFRQKVIALAGVGRTPQELAKQFSVSHQTVRNWLKRADLDAGRRSDGLTTVEREEVIRLRRENKQLRIERDILSKAAAWFARETDTISSKPSNS